MSHGYLDIFRIFFNLKDGNSKLMTQGDVARAIDLFEVAHPSAQVTIDKTNQLIKQFDGVIDDMASFIHFTDKIIELRNGPISPHVDAHLKRRAEIMR